MSTASSMDIDPPSASGEQRITSSGVKVAVHPLAIVNMSDHYTRVTCGGSPLPVHASVVGLLFGMSSSISTKGTAAPNSGGGSSSSSSMIYIMDSDDIPVGNMGGSEAANVHRRQQPVELHQAVFPQHSVVGWYRVSGTDDEPSEHDLQITMQLQREYSTAAAAKKTAELSASSATSSPVTPFLFSLLQAPARPKEDVDMKSNNDEDPELPFTLYQLSSDSRAAALVAVEDWSLETSPPERIALEHVVRTQPLPAQQSVTTTADAKAAGRDWSDPSSAGTTPTPASLYGHKVQEIQHSLHMIESRLAILESFLVDTMEGRIPWDATLLRQVQSLMLWQMGPLSSITGGSSSSSLSNENHAPSITTGILPAQLAILTKTVDAVMSYTDKFKLLQESRNRSSGGGSGSGGDARRPPFL